MRLGETQSGFNKHLETKVQRLKLYKRLTRVGFYFSFFFFNLTYSRWTSSLPSCLWSQRIFASLPGSRLTIYHRDASSALLQLVNQWLNFTYSRSHAFRHERKSTNPTLVRIELTTSALRENIPYSISGVTHPLENHCCSMILPYCSI